MKKSITIRQFLLRILALILPVYMVYYAPLHEDPENPEISLLWKFVILGFLMYFVTGTLFYFFLL